MRALRVVGLAEDGESVICEDPDNGERFTVPADERLRAAARGDLTRLGQVQIELEAQIRPREIQMRIRSGATVQQVAEAADLPESRVERYAHPVLLERAQIAELAQRAHPVREDGPDVQTLSEVVAHTFGMRGHDYAEGSWDAWRGEDGKWVVQLQWAAGKSENAAHWVFHPGAQGGTIAAMDDHAADLLDPSPNRPLRTVRPVTELAREALELDQHSSEQDSTAATSTPADADIDPDAVDAPNSTAGPMVGLPTERTTPAVPPVPGLDGTLGRGQSATAEHTSTRSEQTPAGSAAAKVRSDGAVEHSPADRSMADLSEGSAPVDAADDSESDADDAEPDDEAEMQGARKNHPIVPSWEDVLLGVRSHR